MPDYLTPAPDDGKPSKPAAPFKLFFMDGTELLANGEKQKQALAAPFHRLAAERMWEQLTMARRVSGASLTTFAAVTGFMPTLQAGQSIENAHGSGWMPEFWRLEDAPDRLGRDGLYHTLTQRAPEILGRDYPQCRTSGHSLIAPCPICRLYFEPGEAVRLMPVRSFPAHPVPKKEPCGAPNCVCHVQPPEGEHIGGLIFHAHHLFEDNSFFVPAPTPEQAREQKARRRISAKMRRHPIYGLIYLGVRLTEVLLEWGERRGWWGCQSNKHIKLSI